MNVGLTQICTPLSPSLQIFRPVVHNHAHVYIDCERVCDHSSIFSKWNLSTLILIPTLPKPTAYFSVISSWRLLNQENARVCATWRTYTQCPCIYFLITGSEHDETIWAGAYHKCDQRRLRRACAFVQSCQGHDAH